MKDEIWRISVETYESTNASITKQTFYVLEPSCEVIGLPPASETHRIVADSLPPALMKSLSIRADWTDYIRYRSLPGGFHETAPPPLLSYLKWPNMEEYDKGISKLWLSRIAKEGNAGKYLKKVAERYIVACLVGNRCAKYE